MFVIVNITEAPSRQRYTVLKTARTVKGCAGWTPAVSANGKVTILG